MSEPSTTWRSHLARHWRESTPTFRVYFAAITLVFLAAVALFIAGDTIAGLILLCIYAANGAIVLPVLSARRDKARRRR
jgi:hypothetical protein